MAKHFISASPFSDPTAPGSALYWRPFGGEGVERGIRIGTGGVANEGKMNSTVAAAAARPLFTASQWQELELQARIFKHLAAGEALPNQLIDRFRKSVESMASRFFRYPTAAALGYCSYFGKKVDPEPGRCRRTDGKKWRCSKLAFPDSKYCHRHMHRGRSKKPAELLPQARSFSPPASTVTSLAPTGSSRSFGGSFQSIPLHSLAGGSSSSASFLGATGSPQLLLDPGSYGMAGQEFRYPYWMKSGVDEHSFISESSGSARGLGVDSSLDSSWHLMPSQMSSFPLLKARYDSSLQSSSYLQFPALQELEQASTGSLPKPEQQQQHSFFGSESGTGEPVNHESQSLHPFFDEWPTAKDLWSDLEDERSNQNSFLATQLSISLPMASSAFSTTNSRSPTDD